MLDSSGAIVDSLAFGSEPSSAAAGGNAVVVVHGTAATAVVSGTVGPTYGFSPALGGEAWPAPGGADAFVQTSYGTRWLKIDDGTMGPAIDNQSAVDAAFAADGSIGLVVYGESGLYSVVDFMLDDLGVNIGPNEPTAFENVGGRVFVLAGGKNMQVFRPGDTVTNAFQKLEIVSAEDFSGIHIATWDLVVD